MLISRDGYCSPNGKCRLWGMFGAVVTIIDPVLAAVRQGANSRQVHHAGVRLVSITQSNKG